MKDYSLTPESWPIQMRTARKAKGITQQQLASATGLFQQRISQMETGKVEPRLSEIVAISNMLNMENALFPSSFHEYVKDTFRDCERIEARRNGPRTLLEVVLGDKAYIYD